MRGRLVILLTNQRSNLGIPLQCTSARKKRDLYSEALEDPHHAPYADAASVFESRLSAQITDALGEGVTRTVRFAMVITVGYRILRSLLIVDDKADGKLSTAGPSHIRRVAPIADEITFHKMY